MEKKMLPSSRNSEIKLLENKPTQTIPFSDCADLQEIINHTRCIVNSLEQGIIIYSPDLRYQMFSKNIEKLFGLKDELIVGKTLSDVFHSLEKGKITQQLEDVLKGVEPYNLEFPLKINGNGPNLFVRKIAKAIHNSKGKIIGILGIITDITTDKKREKEEEEAIYFLKESQEKAGIGSYKADFVSGKWESSEVMNKIFGINLEYEKNIKSWLDLIHPDDLEMMENYLQNGILLKGEKFDKEYRIIRKNDKEVRWVHGLGEVKLDDKNNIIYLIGTIQDITEKKQLVEAFSNSNELLTLFLKNSPIFACIKEVTSTESRAIMLSENYEKMLGVKATDLIGKTMEEIYPPELAKQITIDDYGVVLGNEVVTQQEEFNNRKYLTIKFPISQSGKTLVAGYKIDITEIKKTEESLRYTKDLLLSIANGTTDLIFTKDGEGKYTFVNKAFENFVCKPRLEIIQNDMTDIDFGDNKNFILEMDEIVIRNGEYLNYEYELTNGAGEKRTLSIMKGPTYDSEGNLNGLFGISRDITDKNRVEEQLQIRQRMDSLGTLVGGICHDFNNLLAGILGNLELLEISGPFSEKHKRYIDNSILSTNRAAELIKQLQNLSKNSISEKTGFDPYNVVLEVFDLLEKTTDKIVKKIIDFNPGDFYIKGSESEIHQVILNLGTNAFKAIEEKGCKKGDYIKIRVESYRARFVNEKTNLPEGDYVHILFEDNGIGMSEEVRTKAFDPLFTTRKKSGQRGQGLGLAMVYNIVTIKHNGHVYIETKEGKGTTIHLYLPKALPQEKLFQKKEVNLGGGIETILVVEDEKMLQEYIQSALEGYGYKVLVANDGQEGLDMYIENMNNIDLVILDLTMPKLSGQSVLSALLEIKENVKVIISSGQSDEDIRDGILSKAKGFVHKPYPLEKLIKTVKEVLVEK